MAVKLNSTGGGSVTLDSPSTASNYTVTLPSAAGTLATTTGTGSVFTNPTINGFTGDTSAITIGTTQFVKDASGNIGIGTGTPANKVHISGDGSASLLKVQATNTNGTASINLVPNGTGNGQIYTESGALLFSPANTERMRLDASGNLGLGVTPSAWHVNFKALQTGNNYAAFVGDGSNGYAEVLNNCYASGASTYNYVATLAATRYSQQLGTHKWYIAGAGSGGSAISFNQAMTLDASGRLMVGTTSNANGARYTSSDTNNAYPWGFGNITSLASFYIARATDGVGVYLGWGSTSWTANSDERLKTNLKPIENAAQKVSTLRAVTGRYKTDDEGVSRSFLIAQDVQAVLPEAVDSEDPERLGVRYTDTIPLLVAAIKELSAQNNALEARLAKLEAK